MKASSPPGIPINQDKSRDMLEAKPRKPGAGLNYVPGIWDRFPSRLTTVDEAPEPLRSAMRNRLPPPDVIRRLVFGPASRIFGQRSPATLLAVTNTGWLLASDAEDGHVTISECDFANTLFLELTCILLQGQLKIAFATKGRSQCVTAGFNTVMAEYYQEVTQLMLDEMDGSPVTATGKRKETGARLDSLPMKFQHALLHFKPRGQCLVDFVHWPAMVQSRFLWLQHELTPAALLVSTGQFLILISEEKVGSWFFTRDQAKYGNIVAYFPNSRLVGLQVNEQELLGTADIELRTPQGGEILKINFPRGRKHEIAALIKPAMTAAD